MADGEHPRQTTKESSVESLPSAGPNQVLIEPSAALEVAITPTVSEEGNVQPARQSPARCPRPSQSTTNSLTGWPGFPWALVFSWAEGLTHLPCRPVGGQSAWLLVKGQ